MADLVVVGTGVQPQNTTIVLPGIAGAAGMTAGMAVYLDATASNLVKPCSVLVAAAAQCVGILLNPVGINQPCRIAIGGDVLFTAIFTNGMAVVLGQAAGALQAAPATAGGTNFGTLIGIAMSTTLLRLAITPTGALAP